MPSPNNLIASPEARAQRRDSKRMSVLRFLRQHLWSSQAIMQQVLGLASRQATHKTLLTLQEESLVKCHTFKALGGNVTLWGITPHGQAMAFIPGEEVLITTYFEPTRVSEQNIRHQLDLQRLRLKAEAAGWSEWVDGDRLGNISSDGKRPDAIVVDPQGRRTAIECEHSCKRRTSDKASTDK